MKGRYVEAPKDAHGNPTGGAYTDARGVTWVVTVEQPSGIVGYYTFVAQSQQASDAQQYFHANAPEDLFALVDAYAAARPASAGGWLALGLLLLLVLTERKR